MFGRYNLFENDITFIKRLGNKIKIVNVSSCRIPGLEDDRIHSHKKNSVNTEKLSNNISRARSKVQEYALCNEWSHFVTMTLSPDKYNRYDLKLWQKDLHDFLHNFNRRRSPDMKVKYLLIPELHEDGAWHMHGLIKGLSADDLFINEHGYLDWRSYQQRFGFINIQIPRNPDACANYILKYITKDLDSAVSELGAHLYYVSKGLDRPDLLFRGRAQLTCEWDYEHPDHYCRIKTFDSRFENYEDYIIYNDCEMMK